MTELTLRRQGLDRFEWCFLGVVLAILSAGVLSIYSVTPLHTTGSLPIYLKQIILILVGVTAFVVMAVLDYHKIAKFAYVLYGVGLLLLILVLVIGKVSHGAQRWISLGPLVFQPSEFVKLSLILALATYYARRVREGWIQRVIVPGFMALPGLLLILQQPDLGSSLSFLAIYVTLLLAVGVKSKAFGLVLFSSLMLFPFVWGGVWEALHEYQRERIISFVNPAYDPEGKGYQGLQSRIAVGSGEVLGKGFHGSTQTQFKFLPEGHTDFVFAVFAEEWGFLGSLALLALFLTLLLLALEIASKTKDPFGALLVIGIVGMIGFNVIVNIAMTVGLAPIVGIPLPLMSYGGSSAVVTMAALGLLMNVKRRRFVLL